MRGHDGFAFQSLATADSNTFVLTGGAYVIDIVATFGGGSVTLQRLGPDGGTFITAVTALLANGTSGAVALPPGTYKFVSAAAAAGIYVSVTPVPGE